LADTKGLIAPLERERGIIDLDMIFLSGGGDETKTTTVDSAFLKSLPGNSILYIPIAKSADMNGYKKSLAWVTSKLSKLSKNSLNITMLLDLKKGVDLNEFSAIYIGGGNTYKLLSIVRASGFENKLKDYIDKGGLVYGASAGAVLLGQDISTYIEDKYLDENVKSGYTDEKGLGLIGDYSVITHFHDGESSATHDFLTRKGGRLIAIPEGTAALVSNGNLRVIGDGAVAVFDKNGIVSTIEAGAEQPF
jgi:dipeptidase E